VAISDSEADERLRRHWENLSQEVEITSERDPSYNCVAWAAEGDTSRWWQDLGFELGGYYWPDQLRGPQANTVVGWVNLFRWLGYEVCGDAALEPGFEKIAIYVQRDATVEHVARQLESGAWTSKLGKWEDVQHSTLAELTGVTYGQIGPIMKRRRTRDDQTA